MTSTWTRRSVDAAALDVAAGDVGSSLDALELLIGDLAASWSALPTAYSAPEAEAVYGALAPLQGRAEALRADLRTVTGALHDHVDRLASISARQQAIDDERAAILDGGEPGLCLPAPRHLDAAEDDLTTEARESDFECAAALRAIRRTIVSLVHGGVDTLISPAGSTALGITTAALDRYRGIAYDRSPASGGATGRPGSGILAPRVVRAIDNRGRPYGPSHVSSDFVLPLGRRPRPAAPRPIAVFTPVPKLGVPPMWARTTGHALGVLGAGVTLWSAYSTSYNRQLATHPEWTEERRRAEALFDMGVIGGSSLAFGAIGSASGAASGAAAGSLVTPVIGTAVGAVVFGVAGGMAGAAHGERVGQQAAGPLREAASPVLGPRGSGPRT